MKKCCINYKKNLRFFYDLQAPIEDKIPIIGRFVMRKRQAGVVL